MLGLYRNITNLAGPLMRLLLRRRLDKGKEDKGRLGEREGHASLARPKGTLLWIHAASVGEAQSALILVDALLGRFGGIHILVTSGTPTSARLMSSRLPGGAFHQFYPLDHPKWTARFLDHWHPDAVLWMESELWPNMLTEIKRRGIPAALVNGRLSASSFRHWKLFVKDAGKLLETFGKCLVQTETDAGYFRKLGASNVIVTDNLKYSASPLPCDAAELEKLKQATGGRPVWLYASTHAGEEELACRIHKRLLPDFPGLLTILVPRHPERGAAIQGICRAAGLKALRRSDRNKIPGSGAGEGIYIADTLGELGLFYGLVDIACVGRSFSNDGGGGHNPIEAAQSGCAVLHGPNVQNLGAIYREMLEAGACIRLEDEDGLFFALKKMLAEPEHLKTMQDKALAFAGNKSFVINRVMQELLGAGGIPLK